MIMLILGRLFINEENHLVSKSCCCRYGRLEKVQVVQDGHSGRSRGFGFVYFEDIADATEAREALNGTDLDGKKV